MGNQLTEPIGINAERLNDEIEAFSRIGATPGGGVTRLALSDEDKLARDLLATELSAIGCLVLVDDVGNMRGVYEGSTTTGAPIQIASHLDSVVRGGRFDGALGVVAGLEILRTLHDRQIRLPRSIELINWTNEEGARFEPAMLGSGTVTGVFDADWMRSRPDAHGLQLGSELERIGYAGEQRNRPGIGRAYLELHIEQGPVLDDLNRSIGIVEGIVGITWIDITIIGKSDHAGPTPMSLRHDALVAAAELVLEVRRIGESADSPTAGTVGRLDVEPNVINTIPGTVHMSADFRASTSDQLDAMVALLESRAAEIRTRLGVEITIERFWTSSPVQFDPVVIDVLESACAMVGVEPLRLWSGAGHDAKYAAEVQPAGMLFVRSRGGVSHCEEEFSEIADIALGANVLLQATLALAEDGTDDTSSADNLTRTDKELT